MAIVLEISLDINNSVVKLQVKKKIIHFYKEDPSAYTVTSIEKRARNLLK
jgi:hypothetical protein